MCHKATCLCTNVQVCGVQDAAPQWHSAVAEPSAAPLQHYCQVSEGREWTVDWNPRCRVSHVDVHLCVDCTGAFISGFAITTGFHMCF